MKKTFVKIALLSILASCSTENSTPNYKNTDEKSSSSISIVPKENNFLMADESNNNQTDKSDRVTFISLLNKYEEPSQFITIGYQNPKKITGVKGTVLYIDPNDLETIQGKGVGDSIKIELKELLTKSELLRSGAQTVSNSELLVSGGSYYIAATSGGKILRLKPGRNLKAEFPKTTTDEMLVYYGSKINNVMNWNTNNQQFPVRSYLREKEVDSLAVALYSRVDKKYINLTKYGNVYRGSDTVEMSETEYNEYQDQIKEENAMIRAHNALAKRLYGPVELSRLGWINCDRPLRNEDITNLFVSVSGPSEIKIANAYFILKNATSLSQSFFFSKKKGTLYFRNLPKGAEGTIVAYTITNGKILSGKKDITLNTSDPIHIDFKETSESEFKNMITLK